MKISTPLVVLVTALMLSLSGCGGSGGGGIDNSGSGASDSGGSSGGGTAAPAPSGQTTSISPGPEATLEALAAFIAARPGDVIEFECGFFDITSTLLITNTEGVTIKGCGIDETILSFRNSAGVEGILADNVGGLVVQDLTVADTDGNGFELRSVNHGTLSRVRAFWSSNGGRESPDPISADNYQDGRLDVPCTDPATQNPNVPENEGGDTSSPDYTVSDKAGRYGIYPVKSNNILIENSESIGASDAGIYVGQTNNAIIRDSRAAFNVFGFEIENVQGGEYANNVAECNTGGFLIYDLDNITQYGERSRMYGNIAINNNTYNFTEGGFVSNVPPGSGMITLAYDRIDIFDNQFFDNNTGGIIHVSYELFPEGAGRPNDRKIDFYTEGARIFRNEFRNNGNALPAATTEDMANQDIARALPALVGLKTQAGCNQNPGTCPADSTGGYRGAHIIWDGLLDPHDADCPYPNDANGDPVPAHENGKPRHTDAHPNPDCHYNAYKFDAESGERIVPEFFASCIDDDNVFSDDSVTYSNFHGTKGANAAIIIASGGTPTPDQLAEFDEFPADLDPSAHDCEARFGSNLELLPPVEIPPFEPSGDFDPAPTQEEINTLCNAPQTAGEVNFDAHKVNCPLLDQYNLFSDPEDPTSDPNSGGMPFVLNTKLFSDYSVKYRVAFLPPGEKGTYLEPGETGPSATIKFPVGTIIAKTFAFAIDSGTTENIVETRLLIKRENSSGKVRWEGLPYIWEVDGSGNRIARLRTSGGVTAVSWDYVDPDTGNPYSGSTDSYRIPNANQCLSCHANFKLESGSAPIGPKVRNMNRPYGTESSVLTDQSQHEVAGKNQIAYWCDNGLLAGCPDDLGVDANQIAQNVERNPKFNVAGDSGFTAGSDEDIEARVRSWLEVNCHHCHNPDGFAANTGFYLDVFRPVDGSYGICKGPTATGAEGSGGRSVDIHPGDASKSILEFRISSAATTPAAKMPPIARSVVDEEAHALITEWINNVVVADDSKYPGSESCTN